MKNYAYHCTNVNPDIIKKEGWKVGNGYTQRNMFDDLYREYLPAVPVFISNLDSNIWDANAKYCIKLDITGLKLYPDFGSLPDNGAHVDEYGFYWDSEDDIENLELRDYILNTSDDLYISNSDFTGDVSFDTIGTACVDGHQLTNDRIVEVIKLNGAV